MVGCKFSFECYVFKTILWKEVSCNNNYIVENAAFANGYSLGWVVGFLSSDKKLKKQNHQNIVDIDSVDSVDSQNLHYQYCRLFTQ